MKLLADRYQITSPVGRGGMAEVWSGIDIRLNREIAIKVIASDIASDSDTRRRFLREARITARLRHPGVPAVYDFGGDDELYMVMELVPGHTVGTLLGEQGGLHVGWAASIAAQVCAVLEAAHREQLIHRDLKPENLVLCPNGMIKVIDFGIAASLTLGDYSVITKWGDIPMSLHYSAPELMDGEPASKATDLYSVGVLLYELLTAARPFDHGSPLDGFLRDRVALPDLPGVPPDLKKLTHRLLAVDPTERPLDALTVLKALTPWIRDLPPLPPWFARGILEDPVRLYLAALPTE
ncbi:serine/threonine-protein kinase [Nocardia sp. NPDC055029]